MKEDLDISRNNIVLLTEENNQLKKQICITEKYLGGNTSSSSEVCPSFKERKYSGGKWRHDFLSLTFLAPIAFDRFNPLPPSLPEKKENNYLLKFDKNVL